MDGHPALTELVEDRYGNFVHWIEKRGKGVFLQATPVDVARILDGTLFCDSAVAILASATLAVGESFEYVRGRLGLQAASELVVPGQFDYGRQAVLYIPAEMPDPGAEEFSARGARGDRPALENLPRAGLRALHQLPADAQGLREAPA